jgi:hypothetical protein
MQGMPQVTEQHQKLHVLAGNWTGEEQMAPSAWGPGGPRRGKYTGRVECDGFFVSQEYVQEQDGKVSYRGHAIFGYDTQRKQFAWYWVDSMGVVPPAPSYGTWEGNRLVFTSQSSHGDGRYTLQFEGKDRYKFTLENSADGGKTWQTFMSGDYRRG